MRRLSVFWPSVCLVVGAGMVGFGFVVWSTWTVAESFGPARHFTRTIQHPMYPHRAEALWAIGALLAFVAAVATARKRSPSTPAV